MSIRPHFSISDSVLFLNPWRTCAARVTVVGSVCVCVCVLPFQLTSRWFIRPTNDTTYHVGFSALLQRSDRYPTVIFTLQKTCMRIAIYISTTWCGKRRICAYAYWRMCYTLTCIKVSHTRIYVRMVFAHALCMHKAPRVRSAL